MSYAHVIRNIVNELPRHATKKYKRRNLNDIRYVVIHCTDAPSPKGNTDEERIAAEIAHIKAIAAYDVGPNHISKTGCPAFTYHRAVGETGNIYLTSSLEDVTWHAGNANAESIGIALLYRVRTAQRRKGESRPTAEMIESALTAAANISKVLGRRLGLVGHREVPDTSKECPGFDVDMNALRARYSAICDEIGVPAGDVWPYDGSPPASPTPRP